MTFSLRARQAREAAGLTQRQLAERVGVSHQTVSAWETGQAAGMLAAVLFSVADTLGVSARWLAAGDEHAERPIEEPAEIIRMLEGLTHEQREAVLALVKSLAK